jgi:hypothetical protein
MGDNMALGNLSIKIGADISGFTSNLDIASRVAADKMGASGSAVDDFRLRLIQAADMMKQAAQSMGSNMAAANDAIVASSEKSAEAIENVNAAAANVDAKSMGEKIATGVGTGVGVGIVAAQTAWEKFVEWTKMKAIVTGVVVGAIFTAVGLGAVYAAYKVITGSMSFIIGLLTGDSYKSASIDALIAANNQVKEIQTSLHLTAQEATATNAAIAALGVNKSDYTSVFSSATSALHSNTDELDRLGVKYKDAKGNILPLAEVVQNASKVLGQYTEGWDRNQAATAIGLGSAAQVAAAAKVTQAAIAQAGARLDDYNLGIGEETQAAVARYEQAMIEFNRETDLTASGFKRAWADQIMPVLTDLAEYFKDGFPYAVRAFRYSMATVTSMFYGLKTVVYMVGESVVGTISAIGSGLGGLALAAGRALVGDFAGAKDALVSGWTDAKARLGQIGDGIVEQARHNAAAMRQAWALDDRADSPSGKPKHGKAWVAKPKEDDKPAGLLDDVAKRVMEGALKAQEDFIADQQSLLQTSDEFLRHYYNQAEISAKDYYSSHQKLVANNLEATLAAYDKEIEAVQEYIRIHKTQSDKQADIVAAENKIAEIRTKRDRAEMQTNKELALSYLDLVAEKASVAQSLLKADAAENKSYQSRISVLAAWRDAQAENAIEGNRLIEEEEKRHNLAMAQMQNDRNMEALNAVSSASSDMYDVLKNAGKEKTALAKGFFLAEKAIAVAEIIMNANLAASKAEGEFGPFGIPMATYLLASGYARAGIVAGTAIAQASAAGGYDIPAGVNPIVQTHAQEMILPKAQADVIRSLASSRSGDGGGEKLTIINQTTGRVDKVIEQRVSPGERALIIQEAVKATAGSLADPNSHMSRSLNRNLATQRTR